MRPERQRCMGNLRQKLEGDSVQPKHILTDTGVGCRLLVD
jgi:two-component system KDP operon response regulator KdpE